MSGHILTIQEWRYLVDEVHAFSMKQPKRYRRPNYEIMLLDGDTLIFDSEVFDVCLVNWRKDKTIIKSLENAYLDMEED